MRSRVFKGGKWTDGTVRQDKFWVKFYWILDGEVVDDPLLQKRAFTVVVEWGMILFSRRGRSRWWSGLSQATFP